MDIRPITEMFRTAAAAGNSFLLKHFLLRSQAHDERKMRHERWHGAGRGSEHLA
jgi:hypothetical protein